jgi:type IV pilus assembly protein PilN
MIEVNLLPHREARRVADLRDTVALLVLGLVVVCGGIFYVDRSLDESMLAAETSVRQLKANIEQYKPQELQVAAFKEKKTRLQTKLDVIQELDVARGGPLRLMDELSIKTPERLWLTSLTTKGRLVTLEGESLDTGVVADFLRGLNESNYFENVDLESTSRGSAIEGVKVVKFIVRAEMTNPVAEVEKTEEAA